MRRRRTPLATDSFESLDGHCSGVTVSGIFEVILIEDETPLTHHFGDRTGSTCSTFNRQT
jgi:hypothetical protein